VIAQADSIATNGVVSRQVGDCTLTARFQRLYRPDGSPSGDWDSYRASGKVTCTHKHQLSGTVVLNEGGVTRRKKSFQRSGVTGIRWVNTNWWFGKDIQGPLCMYQTHSVLKVTISGLGGKHVATPRATYCDIH
jgi:hypothetical protein